MKNKNWKIPFERPDVSKELLMAGYNPLLAAALSLRGVKTSQEAVRMLGNDIECIHDPMLILNMDKAAARVCRAIENKEVIAVYGDYDVDGITSTCLVTDYLRSKGITCIPYIPDRSEEGYGLNCSAVDTLKKDGVTLIITVDCGITAFKEAEYAKSIGVDMVITDHHECKTGDIPAAVAVIDCKQNGDTYPNPNLAGVGMALKLVCACEGDTMGVTARYAELAAIGTVADVMPLVEENRCLVRMGLKKLQNSERPGIAAIFRETGVDATKVTATTIGYSLAPRLNAAGRLGHAETAAKLLLSTSAYEATELACQLCELNRKRQSIETEIWEDANLQLKDRIPAEPIVLASDKWHQGVIGIAASRLAEQYSIPSIMICLNGEVGKGSCRSYGGFNIFEALSACSEHLIGFGGHALAAGLNIRTEKLNDFKKALRDYYLNNRPQELPVINCDILINNPNLLSIENVRSLELLEPYGNMNPKPVMCMYGVVLESLSSVGGGRHLRMRVRLGKTGFECIFFSHTAQQLGLREGELVDVAFSPQINDFRGHVSVQLLISAVRPHCSKELCRDILERKDNCLYAACRFIPKREDFVFVWRYMGRDFRVGSDFDSVMKQCPEEMIPEKFCLCLVILAQAGLLRSRSGEIYGSESIKTNGKVNLEATELSARLRAFRKECGI